MPKLLLLATLIATMIVPASAAAQPHLSSTARAKAAHRHVAPTVTAPVSSRDPVATAAAIAEGYWGAIPCGGQITIVSNARLAAGLTASTDGWVTFNSSLGADNLNAPAGSYTNCTISLAHSRWATWTAMESDWGMFCLTVVHEMGHLLGHKHSLVPGSVMAPVFTSDANVPSVCNSSWLPGWRTAGR